MSAQQSSSLNIAESLNLERYDPKQFDISFSSSARTDSKLDESFRSNETDKDLIGELDLMQSCIEGIDHHLKYKEMILKTIGNTPGHRPSLNLGGPSVGRFSVNTSPQNDRPQTHTPVPGSTNPVNPYLDDNFGKKDNSASEPAVTKEPQKPIVNFQELLEEANEQSDLPEKQVGDLNQNVLNVPLPTLPKIEVACRIIQDLETRQKDDKKVSKKEIQEAIDKFSGILHDLKEVNQNHTFLVDSEKAQKLAQEHLDQPQQITIPSEYLEEEEAIFEELVIDGKKPKEARERAKQITLKKLQKLMPIAPDDNQLLDLSQQFLKLASNIQALNQKEQKMDPKEVRSIKKDFDMNDIKKSLLDVISSLPNQIPKKVIYVQNSGSTEVQVVDDPEKKAEKKVEEFLKEYSKKLKKTGLLNPTLIANDIDKIRDEIKGPAVSSKNTEPDQHVTEKENQRIALIQLLNQAIDEDFGDPSDFNKIKLESYDPDELLKLEKQQISDRHPKNQKDSLAVMQDFGNIVRSLLALKKCSLNDAKLLAKEPETKKQIDDLQDLAKSQLKISLLPSGQNSKEKIPNLIQSTCYDKEKPKMLELIRQLGLEALPSQIITVKKSPQDFSDQDPSKLGSTRYNPQNEERLIINVINTGPIGGAISDERIEENENDLIMIHSFGDPKPQQSLLLEPKIMPLQLSPSPRFGQFEEGTDAEPSSNRGIQFVSISDDDMSKTNPEDSVDTFQAKNPGQEYSVESKPEESSWSVLQKNSPEYRELRELIRASEALLDEAKDLKQDIAHSKVEPNLPDSKLIENLERIKGLVDGVSKIEKKQPKYTILAKTAEQQDQNDNNEKIKMSQNLINDSFSGRPSANYNSKDSGLGSIDANQFESMKLPSNNQELSKSESKPSQKQRMGPELKQTVQSLYPILDENMDELRKRCAQLMKEKLESDCLSNEDRKSGISEPAVREIRSDLIDLREALNTVPEEILLSEVDPRPERDDDLAEILAKFAEDISKLDDNLKKIPVNKSLQASKDPSKELAPSDVQYYRRVHQLPQPTPAALEESKGLLTPGEVAHFRKVHKLPNPASALYQDEDKLTEEEVDFFKRIHRIPQITAAESVSRPVIESDEVAFFRQVHKLPTPTDPEEATRLTQEEIDHFRKVHKLTTPTTSKIFPQGTSGCSIQDLTDEEKKYFKQIHMIPNEILEQSYSKNVDLSDEDVAYFRRVHKLQKPLDSEGNVIVKLTPKEAAYFRKLHDLAPLQESPNKITDSILLPSEVQYFKDIHKLPPATVPEFESRSDKLTEEEVCFFRKIHGLQSGPEHDKNLTEKELNFFRRVHKLPTKEGVAMMELSRDEVANFRQIHTMPKPAPAEEISRESLVSFEVDFFRKIHKLPVPESKGNSTAALELSEDEVEFFRRVHKLTTPIFQGRLVSDKLTPQEVEFFRTVHKMGKANDPSLKSNEVELFRKIHKLPVPTEAAESISENEIAYFRRVHKLAPPINAQGETKMTEQEIDYFRRVHQLPDEPEPENLADNHNQLSEVEIAFFRQLHRIPHSEDQDQTQEITLSPGEIQYFRQVHQLPKPQGPEYETRNRLTEEEIDYFKKVHRIPQTSKSTQIQSLSKSLDPQEIKFFREIHSLGPKIDPVSDSRPAAITENEIAHFRKVHRLPDPVSESPLYKSKLTDQEVDYFRVVHLLPNPVGPEYQSEVFGLNFSSDLLGNSKASKSKEDNLGVRERLIRDTSRLIEALQADKKIDEDKKVLEDLKKSQLIPAKDIDEAKKFVEASMLFEGKPRLSNSVSKIKIKPNELSISDIPLLLTTSDLNDVHDLSVVLPERLLHIQPLIEEESRINTAQNLNNLNLDDKRTELDDNLRKISTKAFLGQKPVLSKLGDEVKKVMQVIYDQKKQVENGDSSPDNVKISISGTKPKHAQQIEEILKQIQNDEPTSHNRDRSNAILPEKKPIVSDSEQRAEIMGLLEHFLEELKKDDVQDVEFQTIIGAAPALNLEELTQKIQDDKIVDKKLTPQERLALLKGVIRRNLKTEKPVAVAHEDVDSKKQIEDHLSLLKKKSSPLLKQLKDLKTFVRDVEKKSKNSSKLRKQAGIIQSQLNQSKSGQKVEDQINTDVAKIVICDEAISDAVDGIFCIKMDSLNKEIDLAIKLLENNTLKGLKYPLPLRETEENVFGLVKQMDMEFSEELCMSVDEDLETLNQLILSNMRHIKQGMTESAKDLEQHLKDLENSFKSLSYYMLDEDPQTVLEKEKIHKKVQNCVTKALSVLENRDLPVQECFEKAVELVRELERLSPKLVDAMQSYTNIKPETKKHSNSLLALYKQLKGQEKFIKQMENLKLGYLDLTDILDQEVKNLIGNCEKILDYQKETKKDESLNEGVEIRPSKNLERKAPGKNKTFEQQGEYLSSESEFDFKEFTEQTSEDSIAKRKKQDTNLVRQLLGNKVNKTDEERKPKADKNTDLDNKIIAQVSDQKKDRQAKQKKKDSVQNQDEPRIEINIKVEPIHEVLDQSNDSNMTIRSQSFYVEDRQQNDQGKILKDVVRISKPKKILKTQVADSQRKKKESHLGNILSDLENVLLGEDEESFYIQADQEDVKELKDLSKSNVLPFSSLIPTDPAKTTPVFVRKIRDLNPQQKVEKQAKNLLNLDQHEEYDQDEVLLQKQILPTDEWADGKKVYQKVTTREPVDEIDINSLERKPLSYYVNLDPEKLNNIRKTPEQLKLERKQLNKSNPVLGQNKVPQIFEKKEGQFREFEPRIKPKNFRYVILKDDKEGLKNENFQQFATAKPSHLPEFDPRLISDWLKTPGLAIIKLGEKSANNPIIQGIKDIKIPEISLLIQQKGQINSIPVLKKKKFGKFDINDQKNLQLSVSAVKSLKKNPYASCLTNKDIRKILNTLNPSTSVRFYQETGDEVNGTRVIVPTKLESLTEAISGLDEPVKIRIAGMDSKLETPDKFETTYDVYGIDPNSGTAVYNQILRIPGEEDEEDLDRDSIRQIQILDSEEENDDQGYPEEVNIDQTSDQDPFSRVSKPIVDRLHYRSGSPDDNTLFNDEDIQEMKILDMFGNTGDEYEYQMFDPEIQVEDSAIVIYEHPQFDTIKRAADHGDNIRNLASRSPLQHREDRGSRSRSPAFYQKSNSPAQNRQKFNRMDPLMNEDYNKSHKFPIIDRYIQESASRRMDSQPWIENKVQNDVKYRSQQNKDFSPQPKAFDTHNLEQTNLKTPESSLLKPSTNFQSIEKLENQQPDYDQLVGKAIPKYKSVVTRHSPEKTREQLIKRIQKSSEKKPRNGNSTEKMRELALNPQDKPRQKSPAKNLVNTTENNQIAEEKDYYEPSPEEAFRDDLRDLDKVNDMIDVYLKQVSSKAEDIDHEKEIDDRFKDLLEVLEQKEVNFEDSEFPIGSSSMVNNSRKTNKPYANLKWSPLHKIYQNPVLLKNFIAKKLFSTTIPLEPKTQPPIALQVALTALCEWPSRVKRIVYPVGNKDEGKSRGHTFMVKINQNGHWKPIIIDDQVPVVNQDSLDPFILKPPTHEQTKSLKHSETDVKNSPRKCKKLEAQVEEQEIWPQIITKALAKSLLNYERMLQQNLEHYLRLLTGMPVKQYSIDKVDYNLLRLCFKREHICIAKGNQQWIEFMKKECETEKVEDVEHLNHWTVGQVVELEAGDKDQKDKINHDISPEEDNAAEKSPSRFKPEKQQGDLRGEIWVELTNPYVKSKVLKGKFNPPYFIDWSAKDDLRITEDFRKHRNYKKPEKRSL